MSPDDVVIDLRRDHPDWSEGDLLLAAQRRSDSLVDEAIASGRDVMVETVLSSPKFQSRVLAALGAGYEFGFAFVTVHSDSLNVERVRDRVEVGGHDVPEDRIRARRLRSHTAAAWFAERAHLGVFYDNSGFEPVLLASKSRTDPAWRIVAPDEHWHALGLPKPG